jgi:hypothetical protein
MGLHQSQTKRRKKETTKKEKNLRTPQSFWDTNQRAMPAPSDGSGLLSLVLSVTAATNPPLLSTPWTTTNTKHSNNTIQFILILLVYLCNYYYYFSPVSLSTRL